MNEAANRAKPQIPLVLATVFLVYLAQMTLGPIVAPLSREVGLAEWQIGVTISTAAVMVVLTSQIWGRSSQSLGRKPVLVLALVLAIFTMALFTLVSALGMQGVFVGLGLFLAFVVLRGIGFGIAIAAVAPTAQAYIADVTPEGPERVKGMAGVGAVQGIAITVGAVLGGTLSVFGLMVPLLSVPLLLAVALILVGTRLKREAVSSLIEHPARLSPSDSRVWPFLVAGFGMFTALGFFQLIAGFIVQDRFGLTAEMTGFFTGGALLAAGVGMVVSQSIIVPRSGWTPSTLLRVGASGATLGFVLLIPHSGMTLFLAAVALIGLGLGVAMPGYTAGPTLLVGREEQGSLAGLIGATNGLTFVIAPTASTALYGVSETLPLVVGGTIMGLVALFVLLHPRFRAAAQA